MYAPGIGGSGVGGGAYVGGIGRTTLAVGYPKGLGSLNSGAFVYS